MVENHEHFVVSRDLLRAELGQLELRLSERISAEIVKKADLEYVREIHHRVTALEALGNIADRILPDFETIKAELDEIRLHGSREAQDALNRLAAIGADVDKLKLWRSYLAGAVAVSLFLGAFALDVILRRYV